MSKAKKNNAGFTLIEFIIYFSIVSVMFVVVTVVVWDVFLTKIKTDAHQEVIYNGNFIIHTIDRHIKESFEIIDIKDEKITLQNNSGEIWILEFGQDNAFHAIGPAEQNFRLSSNKVDVSGKFINQSANGKKNTIGIEINVDRKNPENLKDYQASISINTAFTARYY